MAFFSKVGNILKQTASKQISADFSASRPSIYQAIRCFSSSKVFVGGLAYATDDQSLREAFGKYGEVTEARVILDRETGRSRGFGFVTYQSSEEASSAIQALDGQELHGRKVKVNYAAERRSTYGPPPGQYGYGGGNFGNYGGNYSGGQGSGGNYGSNYGGDGQGSGGNYGSYGSRTYGGDVGNYDGDGQGSGGNYGSYGSGGNHGGDVGNYGVGGVDNYGGSGSAGNYAGGNTYDGGNSGVYGSSSSGNYGVAGGSGGSDNPAGGYDGSTGLGYGGGDQLGSNESSSMGDQTEGNYRDDDDDTNDFAKRA